MFQHAHDDDDTPIPANDEHTTLAQEADRIIEQDREERQGARLETPLAP